jgi:RNA polymerase sigma-70 factor, ECF subfamily
MELLERFVRGDLDAFETLFEQFQAEVYRWIIRIVRDPGIAEDLTQETFWRVYRSRARFDPSRPFGAWARRVATNVALDYIKRSDRETTLWPHLHAPIANPAIEAELQERLAEAFRTLPAKLRVAATLALIEEVPYEEVADALGMSVGGVKSRVFRAIRLLRIRLTRLGYKP